MAFDYDKFISSGGLESVTEKLKTNPDQAIREITILRETDNPLIRDPNGKKLLDELYMRLPQNAQSLEQTFKPEIPQELTPRLATQSEDIYKSLYNEYTYNQNLSTDDKIRLRNAMYGVRQYLEEQNKDPDKVLRGSRPVSDAIDFVGNVFNIVPHAVAKGISAVSGQDSSKIKIWGGHGLGDVWEQSLPKEQQAILRKVKQGIPLTTGENILYQHIKNTSAPLEIAGDILLDPSIALGAGGKIASTVGKARLARGLNIASSVIGLDPIGAVSEVKGMARLAKVPQRELKEIASTQLLGADTLLRRVIDETPELSESTQTLLKELDQARRTRKWQPDKVMELMNSVTQRLDDAGKVKYADELRRSQKNFATYLADIQHAQKSKIAQAVNKIDSKISALSAGLKEKSGLRKLAISNVPNVGKNLGAKDAFDEMRRLNNFYDSVTKKYQDDIITNVLPALKKHPEVKSVLAADKTKNIWDVLLDVVETPIAAKEMYNLSDDFIQNARRSMDDMLIEEVKYAGSKVHPLRSKSTVKVWAHNADKLKRLWNTNRYHPDIPKVEQTLRDLFTKESALSLTGDVMDEMDGSIKYVMHQMTDQKKKEWQKLGKKARGLFATRYVPNSIATINKLNNEGKLSEYVIDVLNNLAESGKISADKLPELIEAAKELDALKGGKLMETNFTKILGMRGARMARVISQNNLINNIAKYGLNKPEMIDGVRYEPVILNIPQGNRLSRMYFHPDIKKSIEKVFNMVSSDKNLQKYFHVFQDINNLWRSTTLGLYSSTVLRNVMGTLMNAVLAVSNPKQFITSFKDTMASLAGKNYNIVTDRGAVYALNDIKRMAEEGGIFSTTLKKVDTIMQDVSKRTGVVSKASGATIGAVSKVINQLPLAKINDNYESAMKYALFITKIKEGLAPKDALKEVYKYLFDYGDLTDAEKKIKTYFVPFYTFLRKNLPLQIEKFSALPNRILWKSKIAAEKQDETDTADLRYQSKWLQDVAKVDVSKLIGTDQPTYIMLEGLLPQFDLDRLERMFYGGLEDKVYEVLKDVSPFIKTPLENWVFNKSIQMKKPIMASQYDTSEFLGIDMSPKIKNILDDWRPISTLDKFGLNLGGKDKMRLRPEASLDAALLTYFIGSTIPYDQYYSKIIATSDYKRQLSTDINAYRTSMYKVRDALLEGQKMSKKDYERIMKRGAAIYKDIYQGYLDGKIDRKSLGFYTKQLLNNFTL